MAVRVQPDYTGPLVKTLGGADISWLVGWFAAAIVYLLLVALTPGTARHDRQIAATANSHRPYLRPAALAGPGGQGLPDGPVFKHAAWSVCHAGVTRSRPAGRPVGDQAMTPLVSAVRLTRTGRSHVASFVSTTPHRLVHSVFLP